VGSLAENAGMPAPAAKVTVAARVAAARNLRITSPRLVEMTVTALDMGAPAKFNTPAGPPQN
jgi:hypothetical protein